MTLRPPAWVSQEVWPLPRGRLSMDIERLADACGGLTWISEQLFEVEGRLATGLDEGPPLDARVRVLLARSSRRLGQHAQWWRAALPDSPALDGASRVGPPSDRWAQIVASISENTLRRPGPVRRWRSCSRSRCPNWRPRSINSGRRRRRSATGPPSALPAWWPPMWPRTDPSSPRSPLNDAAPSASMRIGEKKDVLRWCHFREQAGILTSRQLFVSLPGQCRPVRQQDR